MISSNPLGHEKKSVFLHGLGGVFTVSYVYVLAAGLENVQDHGYEDYLKGWFMYFACGNGYYYAWLFACCRFADCHDGRFFFGEKVS